MSPESRLVGEGETTVTESAPREVPGESDSVGEREHVYVSGSSHFSNCNSFTLATVCQQQGMSHFDCYMDTVRNTATHLYCYSLYVT